MSESAFDSDSDNSLDVCSEVSADTDDDYIGGIGGYIEFVVDSENEDPSIKSYNVHDRRSGEEILADLGLLITSRYAPSRCPDCGKTFRTANALKLHSYKHTGVKPFKCKYCSDTFLNSARLDIHHRTHTGDKPFKCSICNFAASSSTSLQKHEKIHYEEKNHKCDQCDYRTIRADALKVHYKKHTGEKPFACRTCSYKCSRRADLHKHQGIHTGEKKYKCRYTYCSYRCNVRGNMKRHEMRHTETNVADASESQAPPVKQVSLVKCPLCNYCTANSETMKRHVEEHSMEFVVIQDTKIQH